MSHGGLCGAGGVDCAILVYNIFGVTVEDCAVQVVWTALSWFRLSLVSCGGLCGAGGVDCTVLVWNIFGVTVSCGGLCSAGEESFFTFHWMIPGA